MNYKLIISNRTIYKEIEVQEGQQSLSIGTDKDCNVRLHTGSFPCGFVLEVVKTASGRKLVCSEGVYLTFDSIKKYLSCPIKHGDHISLRVQSNSAELLDISFVIDFESKRIVYDLEIETAPLSEFTIGCIRNADVVIQDPYVEKDSITIKKQGKKYSVIDNGTRYGVQINGNRINKTANANDGDFISFSGYFFYLKNGNLITMNCSEIQTALKTTSILNHTTSFSYPHFNRSTRVKYVLPQLEVELQKSPPKNENKKKSFLLSLLPSLAMIALILVVRGGMGSDSSNISFVLYSVISMAIGVATSIVSFVSDSKDEKKKAVEREEAYRAYIDEKKNEIVKSRQEELRVLNLMYPSLRADIAEVLSFGKRIFERNPGDDDFLDVWLGKGRMLSKYPIKYQKQDYMDAADEISLLPEKVSKESAYIENAPVVAHLKKSNCIGACGNIEGLRYLFHNIVVDIASRHFYKDVQFYFWLSAEEYMDCEWIKWLQHTQNETLGIRNIMCDEESRNILLEYLFSLLSKRETENAGRDGETAKPQLIVFVFDSKAVLAKHPISHFFTDCQKLGVTFVFLEQAEEYLPQGCNEIIRLQSSFEDGAILDSSNGDELQDFSFPRISNSEIFRTIQKLSGIYVDEVNLESELTHNISLFELLGILDAEDLDLRARWSESKVFKSMSAPLGVKKKGEVVYLDIGDKAYSHGPHGLVAGTTGSGKSEILQTYVLSMATLFHPYDVGFVIIDFKGGGMANQFRNLPHLIGTITNIDGDEIERSLMSIKAELVRRQQMFSECGVNHINDYIKLFKQGKVKQPLPHLIMIVDEFAELKADFPDFMKEIVSAARIGRTLGVHLILATQKPSGVVDDQIWSNSKFKLCLKVQTKEDSQEVIKSPLAAEIVEPGRAYFQVGNNEIFELFQSAYSGAKVMNLDEMNAKAIEIYALNAWGKRSLVYTNKNSTSNDAPTQLDAVVDYIHDYCEQNAIQKLPSICLEPLEEVIDIDVEPVKGCTSFVSAVVPVGIFDDPSHQRQGVYSINLSEENVMAIGSSRFGKTNFLQILIRSLASQYTPDQVNIYILDFASMILKTFEPLNHVGGVVCATDDEKLKNFFKMIYAEMEIRKQKLVDAGVSSFVSYLEAGHKDLQQVVIMVDNLTALRETYYQDDDDPILGISREGLTVGISVVVTNSQTSGIGYRYLANFSSRIALYNNDGSEYSNLFESCRMKPQSIPGRCLVAKENEVYQCQQYRAFRGEKEYERVQEMKSFIVSSNKLSKGKKARQILSIPAVLTENLMSAEYRADLRSYSVPIGLSYSDVTPFYLDLSQIGILGLCGKEKTGHKNFIRHIITSLEKGHAQKPCHLILVDDVSRKLVEFKDSPIVDSYMLDLDTASDALQNLYKIAEQRYEGLLMSSGTDNGNDLYLMIIQNDDFAKRIGDDMDLTDQFKEILSRFKGMNVSFVFSNVPNSYLSFDSPEPFTIIKEAQHIIFFEDLENLKLFDVPYEEVKAYKKRLTTGDAYYILDGTVTKLKIVKSGS